jgi:hypothetical protein
MPSGREIFARLIGTWQFERTIVNTIQSNLSGTVIGEATFSPVVNNPTTLYYLEKGKLRTNNGMEFNVSKSYLYRETQSGKINVHSDEDHHPLLFSLNPDKQGCAKASHFCVNDVYDAGFKFGENEFAIDYVVQGPNKNYTSRTTYKR